MTLAQHQSNTGSTPDACRGGGVPGVDDLRMCWSFLLALPQIRHYITCENGVHNMPLFRKLPYFGKRGLGGSDVFRRK